MRKLALAVFGAAAMMATPANASQFLEISGDSGAFGNDNSGVTCGVDPVPCAFSEIFQFVTPEGYTLSTITISSGYAGNNVAADINFTSVTFNGVELDLILSGRDEYRRLYDQLMTAGATNTIMVSGTSGGAASYAGTLAFAQNAVPEPATWGMMLLGFGMIGAAMRRRKTSFRTQIA